MDWEATKRKADEWYNGTDTDHPTLISQAELSAAVKLNTNGSTTPGSTVTTKTSSPLNVPTCTICNDAGLLSLGPIIYGQSGGGVVECDACGIVAKRRVEKEVRLKTERAAKYLIELRAGLGRLAECSFASFAADRPLVELAWNNDRQTVGAQRRAIASAIVIARVYAADPQGWLYLYGPPGAGKSHLAAAIANDLVKNGEPVAYASVPELLAFLKRGMSDNSADARIEGLITIDCLILDDLGAESVTPWSTETLFRLVDERVKHDRPTVVTSNVHFDALQFRIASRIAGASRLVPLLISDYRRLSQ